MQLSKKQRSLSPILIGESQQPVYFLLASADPTDLTTMGEFKAVSQYKVEFTTRLKKKDKAVTRTIFTIVKAAAFVDAFSRIRRDPALVALRGLSPSEADSRTNKSINREVIRGYGDIIPAPFTEDVLSAHNLRAAGARVAYHLYGKVGEDAQRFIELQLIHDSKAASANYNDYYCVGSDGKEITVKGLREGADKPLSAKPKSTKTSSVSVDAQLREMLKDSRLEGKTHAKRIEYAIARALKAEDLEKKISRLEAQLARECEKRQKAELDLKRLQESTATEAKPKRRKMTAEGVFHADDINFQGKRFEDEDDSSDAANGFDWRSVPNAELNGDRRHDAYTEKLRRTVEAVQDYNAGLEHSEHFSITGSLLRQITGVKPKLVKQWMTENKAALDSYNAGYSSRQNVGKPDVKTAIKWSEQAYGEYEW